MYGSLRFKVGFREDVDKFIEAAKKHATTLKENKDIIICPYKDWKNRMAWTDVIIIRSYLIMRGFVEDYTVWIHHDETVIVNDEDEEEYDDETIESLSQYSAELDARMDFEFGNEQGGDAGGESASSPLVGFGWLNDNMIKGLTRLLKCEQVIGYLIGT